MNKIILALSILALVSCQDKPKTYYNVEQKIYKELLKTYIWDSADRPDIVYSTYVIYDYNTFDSIQQAEYIKAKEMASKLERMRNNPNQIIKTVSIKAMPLESDTNTFK